MANNKCGGGGVIYGLGLVGALVYYIQNADSVLNGFIGILKAVVWPAMMVYHLLGVLQI